LQTATSLRKKIKFENPGTPGILRIALKTFGDILQIYLRYIWHPILK